MNINLISNTSWYLFNFRSTLIKQLIDAGHNVNIIAPFDNYVDRLVKLGANYHEIKLTRFKKSIFWYFIFILKLVQINYDLKPDIIHHFTIKPVIYGSIASWFYPSARVINSIPGLGLSFNVIYNNKWINKFIMVLYRIAFKREHKIIFQNPDDMNFFIKKGILDIKQCYLIKSSGVDMEKFHNNRCKRDGQPIKFGIMGRMIWSKGVLDFVEASTKVYSRNKNTRFYLLGSPDPHSPDSIPYKWLQEINNEEHIVWLEHSDNVKEFLSDIDVFVLPTYYPEGLPKSLIEAGAMGLPLITTNSPGCKEVVQNGYNGILVNVKDQVELSERMYELSLNRLKIERMGKRSRKLIKSEYDVKIVNNKTIELYKL